MIDNAEGRRAGRVSNIGSYEERLQGFDWSIAERELGYRAGDIINIGYHCSDRICHLGQGGKLALLWEDHQGREKRFTFDDLRNQLQKMRNMGPLENLLNMIPGMNKMKDVTLDEKEFVKVEAIINSMTKRERKDHSVINGSRRRRIALGSGTTVPDVNRVLKQYIEIKRMLKMFKGKKGFKLPKGFPF